MLTRPAYPLICATLAASLIACHTDVDPIPTASAGDPENNLSDSGADAPEDDPDFDPLDHCTSKPDETFGGTIHRCEGDFSSSLVFDYYGDPDLGIESVLVCLDHSDVKVVEPGYVFTCYVSTSEQPFGTEGVDVDTCCLADPPEEAILPLCRIDAAEEICEATSDKLNELRKQIPALPKLAEVNKQLLNLNKHIAQAKSQEDCASTFADGFVEVGDIGDPTETVDWGPGDNSDPETGWPWLRNIDLNVTGFHIDDTVDAETACGGAQKLDSILDGTLAPLILTLDGPVGQGDSTASSGRFTLAMDECSTGACRAELRAIELDIPDFEVGPVQLSGLSVQLAQPAQGHINGTQLRVPGHELALMLQGSARALSDVTIAGLDFSAYLDGRRQHVTVRASEDFVAEIDAGQLVITELQVDTWPITAQVATANQ